MLTLRQLCANLSDSALCSYGLCSHGLCEDIRALHMELIGGFGHTYLRKELSAKRAGFGTTDRSFLQVCCETVLVMKSYSHICQISIPRHCFPRRIFASTPKMSFASPIPHDPRPECHGRGGVPAKHARQQTSRNPPLSHASVCLSCPVKHMHGYQECVIELARGPYSVLGGSNDCPKRLGDLIRKIDIASERCNQVAHLHVDACEP